MSCLWRQELGIQEAWGEKIAQKMQENHPGVLYLCTQGEFQMSHQGPALPGAAGGFWNPKIIIIIKLSKTCCSHRFFLQLSRCFLKNDGKSLFPWGSCSSITPKLWDWGDPQVWEVFPAFPPPCPWPGYKYPHRNKYVLCANPKSHRSTGCVPTPPHHPAGKNLFPA